MTDITKCSGQDAGKNACRQRDKCRRFTAPSDDQWQSWMTAPPVWLKCEMFLEDTREIRRTPARA